MRGGVVVGVVLVVVAGCSKKAPPAADAGPAPTVSAGRADPAKPTAPRELASGTPPKADPETLPPEEAAADTARAIKSLHPAACKAASNNSAWAGCHDETKGYDRVLACARRGLAKARAARAQLPKARSSVSVCGKAVEGAAREVVDGSAELLEKVVAWLEANRSKLAGPLATAPLSEACDTVDCSELPSEFTIEKASYARVSSIECTMPLFRCGGGWENVVCRFNEVASRLGVACDPAENKTSSPLLVRATGRLVN